MFLDGPSLALFLLALTPSPLLAALLRFLLPRRHLLLAGLALLAGLFLLVRGGVLRWNEGMIAIPGLLLFQLWAGLQWLSWSGRGGVRARTAHLLWAFLPAVLLPAVMGAGRFFEAPGTASFWLTDLVGKLYLGVVAPVVAGLRLPDASPIVFAFLGPRLASLSDHFLAGYACLHLLLTPALYVYISRRSRCLPPLRHPFAQPLHPLLFGAAASAIIAAAILDGPWPLRLAGDLGLALLGTWGIARMAQLAWLLRGATWLLVPALCLLVAAPVLAVVPVVVGALDSLGLRPPTLDDALRAAPRRHAYRVLGESLARWWNPLSWALLLVVPALAVQHLVLDLSRAPGLRLAPVAQTTVEAGLVSLAGPAGRFSIERTEAPAPDGTLPLVGRSPQQAEAACAARGLQLCTDAQWSYACSGGADRYYPSGGDVADRLRSQEMVARCNLDDADGQLAAPGAHPDCTANGTVDMPGNAWEWVAVPERPGWYGLAGGYFRYGDEQTHSCGFRLLVHEAMAPSLDLQVVGHRCCSAGAFPTDTRWRPDRPAPTRTGRPASP